MLSLQNNVPRPLPDHAQLFEHEGPIPLFIPAINYQCKNHVITNSQSITMGSPTQYQRNTPQEKKGKSEVRYGLSSAPF